MASFDQGRPAKENRVLPKDTEKAKQAAKNEPEMRLPSEGTVSLPPLTQEEVDRGLVQGKQPGYTRADKDNVAGS